MKITPDALTPVQKHLLQNGVMPDLKRAEANLDLQEQVGFQAFKIAQFSLKMTGLLNADYSVTVTGNALLAELLKSCSCGCDEFGEVIHSHDQCPIHGPLNPIKESAMSNPIHANRDEIKAKVPAKEFDPKPGPAQCHDKGCLCHDTDNPDSSKVHVMKCICVLDERGSVLVQDPECPICGALEDR